MRAKVLAIKALVGLIISLSLLSWTGSGHSELVDRIVAIVNDDVITLSELNKAIEPYAKQIQSAPYGPDEKRQMLLKVRQDMLDNMIGQKLTDQEGNRLGISVAESEVDRRVEKIKSERFFTEKELRRTLQAEGYTLEEYRRRIKEQLLGIKLINLEIRSKIAITEEEIREYYENHHEDFGGTSKYHLSTILVRVPSWDRADDREVALKKVELILDALNGGTPFEEVARRYSDDITAEDGGDLGFFAVEELAPELRETLRWMKEGEISAALQTSQGYQLILVQDIKGSQGRTLEEARIEIQERMYREMAEKKYKAWLDALRERSYIKVIQ
jgi:peptidyl-prolyl cis-trans isomerase SurA